MPRPATFPMLVPFLALLAACTVSDGGGTADTTVARTGDTTVAATARDTARDTAGATAAATIPPITREMRRDLTGDGREEVLSLAATGTRIDSLDVRLEIRDSTGRVLHVDRWSTRDYFQYADRDSVTPDSADALVRRLLDDVLTDGAIVPTRAVSQGRDAEESLRDAIRYDIAERALRRELGIPAGEPLRGTQHDSLSARAKRVPAAPVGALARELAGRRAFRWHSGGEVTTGIAWSPTERRFVTVFSCC